MDKNIRKVSRVVIIEIVRQGQVFEGDLQWVEERGLRIRFISMFLFREQKYKMSQ